MLFDAPYPMRLTRAGRIALTTWAALQVAFVVLLLAAAWLR